nr:hypothetical protein GCM10020093_024050 [Planobispora longispora]
MRRVLGLATGLVLASTALVPAASAAPVPAAAGAGRAGAACRTDAGKCGRDPLIAIAVKVRATPAARPGGKVTYVIDYSQTWTPSFAPYWGALWVGGRFPKGRAARSAPRSTTRRADAWPSCPAAGTPTASGATPTARCRIRDGSSCPPACPPRRRAPSRPGSGSTASNR